MQILIYLYLRNWKLFNILAVSLHSLYVRNGCFLPALLALHLWGEQCWKMMRWPVCLPPSLIHQSLSQEPFKTLSHSSVNEPMSRISTCTSASGVFTKKTREKKSRFVSSVGCLSLDWLTHSSNRPRGGSGDQLEAVGTNTWSLLTWWRENEQETSAGVRAEG